MNVIISNLNSSKFLNLDVDIIKSISGEFSVDEIIQSFSNFFFNRMFLDITAISGYKDVNNLKKLSMNLDVSKIILLLSNEEVVNSESFLSNLVSMGFYNFARDENELKYLYQHPNSYKDVAQYHKIDNLDANKIDVSVGSDARVIGFKNYTNHAGATSLIYMLKKQLSHHYYVVGIEVNKRDFMFFRDNDMVSVSGSELKGTINKYKDANVILIDLNDLDEASCYSICQDVIYLMESGTLGINKMLMLDKDCFSKISREKVVLNQSLLTDGDVHTFESESGIQFFSVLPPMNDRGDNSNVLFPFLAKLELYKKV